MSDAAEILQSVQIGLNVFIFLLNTDRGPQATELCVECAVLLQNLDRDSHLDISDVISNAYYGISGNTNAERYTKKLLYTKKKEKETGTSERCFVPWASIRWLKNVTGKHLPLR